MTASKVVKYNPSFLTDSEVTESFVVRHATLELVLEALRDNVHDSNQHVLIIGPRGSGKTTLLRRVAAAVRHTPELEAQWFPLPFGEESYEVASAGQFWLEAIFHLGVQTKDPQWRATYAELLKEPDEKRLEARCLARLMDFADSKKQHILLLVENLNLIMGEQVSEDDAWALRKILMSEPRLMLISSATTRFDAIDDPKQALFELFRITELERLTIAECQSVWKRGAGHAIPEAQARAVQILTGGNPRLLTILAIFGANRSFHSLLDDLSLLVDEHTDYFKSNFESLPTTERKVFACLATLWEDSSAADVARAARMTSSQVSAQLKRLTARGAVKTVNTGTRKQKYQLSERLYNIYYLMRRGHESGRVRAVVNFMVQFYGKDNLHEAVKDIAKDACRLSGEQRNRCYDALKILRDHPDMKEKYESLRTLLPMDFWNLADIPEEFLEERIQIVRQHALDIAFAFEQEGFAALESGLQKFLDVNPDTAMVWAHFGCTLAFGLNKPEAGLACLCKAVELEPNNAIYISSLACALALKHNALTEAENLALKALSLNDDPAIHGTLSLVLGFQRLLPEALHYCELLLQHPETVQQNTQTPTTALCMAAAQGHGRAALNILEASPSLQLLEPVAVGLRRYLNLEATAPQEVREIAEDIVTRIKQWKVRYQGQQQ